MFCFDSLQMTDNNSPKSKSTVDPLNAQDDQNQASDQLPVVDADDIVNESVVSAGLSTRSAIRASVQRIGNDRNNTLRGTNDDDVLRGRGRNDRLLGLGGDDRLFGNAGNDQLFGDTDDDRLFGGNGSDSLNGGSDRDRLEGENGNDTLIGGSGQDTLLGGSGLDLIEGNSGNDQINGENSADTLLGGTGDDRIIGGTDRDVITGALGQDTLSGGPGADLFIYNSFDDRGDLDEDSLFDERGDELADFNTDIDTIDLSRLFTGSNYSTSDRFDEYVLLVNDDDDNTFIRVDIDGDSGDDPFRTLATVEGIDFDDIDRSNFII